MFEEIYDPLNNVVNKCRKEQDCTGIYDKQCDGNGPFNLCSSEIFKDRSIGSDCSYIKISGKNNLNWRPNFFPTR